jgi:SAM-dependent methyltransferase
MNPWLEIPLEEYEAHMSMTSVGQAQFLARVLEERVNDLCPGSVAVIGCAGGNGIDLLPPRVVKRVVGIDVNPKFIAATQSRYDGRFAQLDLICKDFVNLGERFEAVDFAFAGLVFEYVDFVKGLSSLARIIKKGGHLSAILQMPHETIAPITPTCCTSLRLLDVLHQFVPVSDFEAAAECSGFSVKFSNRLALPSGKIFQELLLKRRFAG